MPCGSRSQSERAPRPDPATRAQAPASTCRSLSSGSPTGGASSPWSRASSAGIGHERAAQRVAHPVARGNPRAVVAARRALQPRLHRQEMADRHLVRRGSGFSGKSRAGSRRSAGRAPDQSLVDRDADQRRDHGFRRRLDVGGPIGRWAEALVHQRLAVLCDLERSSGASERARSTLARDSRREGAGCLRRASVTGNCGSALLRPCAGCGQEEGRQRRGGDKAPQGGAKDHVPRNGRRAAGPPVQSPKRASVPRGPHPPTARRPARAQPRCPARAHVDSRSQNTALKRSRSTGRHRLQVIHRRPPN